MSVIDGSVLSTAGAMAVATTTNVAPIEDDDSQYMLDDLQLAAELGKTLLERNKELEGSLKHQQSIIDDQSQEIEYLTKQSAALREVNDSRLRIYENLEVSINDIEKSNTRLLNENATIKKLNKTLCQNSEQLEAKYDELTRQFQDINRQYDIERRKNEKILKERLKQAENGNTQGETISLRPVNHFVDSSQSNGDTAEEGLSLTPHNPGSDCINYALRSSSMNGEDVADGSVATTANQDNEEIFRVVAELKAFKRQCTEEQERVAELEEQLNSLIQENQLLANRIQQTVTNDEIKSMHDELSILDEVRYGKMCSRCMRSVDVDDKNAEDELSIVGTEDGDDNSLLETRSVDAIQHSYRSAVTIKVGPTMSESSFNDDQHTSSPNPYRELVEKYEALLEVQRQTMPLRNRIHQHHNSSPQQQQLQQSQQHQHQSQPLGNSLQDELTSGDFSSINTKDTDDAENRAKPVKGGAARKTCLRTPTDFSEAETSSSGFSDETSNKCTQTDETFLCTIADGEDKFSIYDDASPIDSRFRNRPEYRELFKEIFAILKKAAENKDDGEKLPLLDDANPCFKVPPVTPAVEELPAFPDETESIISSVVSEQSVAMSERITKQERKTIFDTVKKHVEKNGQENKPPIGKQIMEDGRVLTPYKRQPLEYLAVSVNIRKKNRKKSRSTTLDRSDSPAIASPPRVFYTSSGKKRRDMRSTVVGAVGNTSPLSMSSGAAAQQHGGSQHHANNVVWNGTSMTIYNRNMTTPPQAGSSGSVSANTSLKGREFVECSVKRAEFKRTSTASQDLHKLMKLDLSYAEVLRRADTSCKHQQMMHLHHQHHRKH